MTISGLLISVFISFTSLYGMLVNIVIIWQKDMAYTVDVRNGCLKWYV